MQEYRWMGSDRPAASILNVRAQSEVFLGHILGLIIISLSCFAVPNPWGCFATTVAIVQTRFIGYCPDSI